MVTGVKKKKKVFIYSVFLCPGQGSAHPEDPCMAAVLLRSQQAPGEGYVAGATDDVWLKPPSL